MLDIQKPCRSRAMDTVALDHIEVDHEMALRFAGASENGVYRLVYKLDR